MEHLGEWWDGCRPSGCQRQVLRLARLSMERRGGDGDTGKPLGRPQQRGMGSFTERVCHCRHRRDRGRGRRGVQMDSARWNDGSRCLAGGGALQCCSQPIRRWQRRHRLLVCFCCFPRIPLDSADRHGGHGDTARGHGQLGLRHFDGRVCDRWTGRQASVPVDARAGNGRLGRPSRGGLRQPRNSGLCGRLSGRRMGSLGRGAGGFPMDRERWHSGAWFSEDDVQQSVRSLGRRFCGRRGGDRSERTTPTVHMDC